jgi:hypothetical protein
MDFLADMDRKQRHQRWLYELHKELCVGFDKQIHHHIEIANEGKRRGFAVTHYWTCPIGMFQTPVQVRMTKRGLTRWALRDFVQSCHLRQRQRDGTLSRPIETPVTKAHT